jgi:hypothetical protein
MVLQSTDAMEGPLLILPISFRFVDKHGRHWQLLFLVGPTKPLVLNVNAKVEMSRKNPNRQSQKFQLMYKFKFKYNDKVT